MNLQPASVAVVADLSGSVHLPSQFGQFEIVRELGRGGMGVVYEAIHELLKKRVAVKVISTASDTNDSVVERFLVEMEAIGQLNSPNIVAAYDAGQVQGVYYLVMEYVDGPNLSAICKAEGKLSVPNALEAVRQTALGLEHAHQAGLVHRDIKPSNLMLNSEGIVKVADLGLAKVVSQNTVSSELTAAGGIVGTLNYIAPEQIEGEKVDARTDLYSLGCTLYHLIAGRPPFHGEKYGSAIRKMRAHTSDDPIPPSHLVESCGEDIDEIIARLMSKDPTLRWPSAAALAAALKPLTTGADLKVLVSDHVEEVTASIAHEQFEQSTSRHTSPTVAAQPAPQGLRASWKIWAAIALFAAVLFAGALWGGRQMLLQPQVKPDTDTSEVDSVEPGENEKLVPPAATAIDYSTYPAGEWIDLLQHEPVQLVSEATADADAAAVLLQQGKLVLNGADQSLYSLGMINAPSYVLKFDIYQKRWYGGFGVFLGYQRQSESPNIHGFDVQMIGPENRRKPALCRSFHTVQTNASNGKTLLNGETLPCQTVEFKGLKSQTLEIRVVNEKIASVWWNGKQMESLTHFSVDATAGGNPCVGDFGIHLNVTDAEITKAEILIGAEE